MSKVFVVQDSPGKSLLGAKNFGELRVIINNSKEQTSEIDNTQYVDIMKEKLRGFSDRDYILPIGDPSLIGLACAIAAGLNGGRFKCLKWDRREKEYYAVSFKV